MRACEEFYVHFDLFIVAIVVVIVSADRKCQQLHEVSRSEVFICSSI